MSQIYIKNFLQLVQTFNAKTWEILCCSVMSIQLQKLKKKMKISICLVFLDFFIYTKRVYFSIECFQLALLFFIFVHGPVYHLRTMARSLR